MMLTYSDMHCLCDSILRIDNNIQSVAIINKFGRAVEKTSRPEYATQFSTTMDEMLFMHSVLQVSLDRDLKKFGAVKYHFSARTGLNMLTFPFGEDVILVTINKRLGPTSVARKISLFISDQKKPYHVSV